LSRRGHDRERAVKKLLEEEGWLVVRAAGSLGYDLVALKLDHAPRVIEVKSTAQSPYEHFGPQDRAELLAAAERAGAVAELAYWPSRGKLRWIKSEEWPQ
jgi:Holliday junction resolvase